MPLVVAADVAPVDVTPAVAVDAVLHVADVPAVVADVALPAVDAVRLVADAVQPAVAVLHAEHLVAGFLTRFRSRFLTLPMSLSRNRFLTPTL